mmetsp:Transcript_31868/g.48489  ORF Transcript_31868/g.48489 Transcript_31868/m.48489 type:complete len:272 (-) Transcript_31868:476-1291(-)|eukprot:CAMPEP_0194202574 /NCGR_PEP_ID=MMETSP0156-20130528/2558_1 /TAXON_ID=33649 /ORGANISM="Thalassionema nitzschioides, Strain L26-B" /LENGTH=271 /DNA_ID=CAMNT_0038928099 /DNA_START=73 /DNA_END=888 /DNA_ORIENTATION=-
MDDDHNEEFDKDGKLFPQRLMEILSDPAHTDTIMWCPNGRIFTIIDRQKFALTVLPKYFGGKEIKYASFSRKLKRWNFRRVTMKGRGPVSYHHEYFQRDNEALCTQMYCNNIRAKFAVAKTTSEEKNKESSKHSSSDYKGYAPTMVEVIASNSAVKGVSAKNKQKSLRDPSPDATPSEVSSNSGVQRQLPNVSSPALSSLGVGGLDPLGLQTRALLLRQAGFGGIGDGFGPYLQPNLARLMQLQALAQCDPTQDLYASMLRRKLGTAQLGM